MSNHLSPKEVLDKMQGEAYAEIDDLSIFRRRISRSNRVASGEFSEYLLLNYWKQDGASASERVNELGWDIQHPVYGCVQVKGRRPCMRNPRWFHVKDLDNETLCAAVVLVLFNRDWTVQQARLYTRAEALGIALPYVRPSGKYRSWRIYIRRGDKSWDSAGAELDLGRVLA